MTANLCWLFCPCTTHCPSLRTDLCGRSRESYSPRASSVLGGGSWAYLLINYQGQGQQDDSLGKGTHQQACQWVFKPQDPHLGDSFDLHLLHSQNTQNNYNPHRLRKLSPCPFRGEPPKLSWTYSPCISTIQPHSRGPTWRTYRGRERPRAGCLLWWPWACLPIGPAEPDVDEDKLQATGTVECPVHKNCPQQEDLPLGQKQL